MKIFSVILLVGVLAFGFVWFYLGNRYSHPVAVSKIEGDLASGLMGSPSFAFFTVAKKDLLESLAVSKIEGRTTFSFSNRVKTANGDSINTCRVFRDVEAEFLSEGMAVSGEHVRMKLVGPCSVQNEGAVKAFELSKADLVKKRVVANSNIQFQETKVSFSHNLQDIPDQWYLHSLRFHTPTGKVVEINRDDLKKSQKDPLFFNF